VVSSLHHITHKHQTSILIPQETLLLPSCSKEDAEVDNDECEKYAEYYEVPNIDEVVWVELALID
jgi:hypothetical protein